MAIQEIKTHHYKDIFELSIVDFKKACTVHNPKKIDTYSIFWITEGKGTYHIDFKQYNFNGNVVFFLSPGQVFSVASEVIKKAYKLSFKQDFYCVETHDKAIACNGLLFNNIYETPFVTPNDVQTKKLENIIQSIAEEISIDSTAQYDMLQSLLKQFIIASVRIKNETSHTNNNTETKLFKDFSVLVEKYHKQFHSVTNYAERLGVSPKSLTKHFQKMGIQTPSDFIKDKLLLEAKRALRYTDITVKEIAYELGFNDPAYFSRFFTKATQKTPLQFRKEQ